jgi:YfiH family protein
LITNIKDVALVTSVADCQWILLYDTKNKVIGNIHSGRRWTLSRIGTIAIDIFIKEFNSDPKDIKVYISPSIHQCCFEVWEQVKTLFEDEFTDIQMNDIIKIWEFKDNEQKYYIDTIELNRRVLLNLWIKSENIIISNECSVCNSERIHSYRKDKPNDWRNILLVSLK